MLNRFARIRREFGTVAFARTIFLLVGLVGLSLFGIFGFASPWPAIISAVGLVLGWLLRRVIVDHFDVISWAIPGALFAYGVVLFLGEKVMGISRESQLVIITITTVLLFGAQFWSLSDPEIVNPEKDGVD